MLKTFMKTALAVLALFTASLHADNAFVADQSFGAEMPAAGDAISLLSAIEQLDGAPREVKIMGQITEVCQAEGCWMILTDGEQYARVTFKDYGFFVPTETSMQRAVIYGVLEETSLSPDTAAHFAADAGDKEAAEELARGEAVREFSLVASAVQLENRH